MLVFLLILNNLPYAGNERESTKRRRTESVSAIYRRKMVVIIVWLLPICARSRLRLRYNDIPAKVSIITRLVIIVTRHVILLKCLLSRRISLVDETLARIVVMMVRVGALSMKSLLVSMTA